MLWLHNSSHVSDMGLGKHTGSQFIDIQTSIRDWNHPVFHAGSLLLEVILSFTPTTTSTIVFTF